MFTVRLFSRWVVHTALERHFGRMWRRRLFRVVLAALRTHARVSAREQWALLTADALVDRRNLRAHFLGWKSVCVFVEWSSAYLLFAERRAVRHFVSALLRGWLRAARSSRQSLQAVTGAFLTARVRRVFKAWWCLRQLLVRRRDELLGQCFTRLRDLVSRRGAERARLLLAMGQCIGIKKLGAFRRWARRARTRALLGARGRGRGTRGGYRLVPLKRRALLLLSYYAAVSRRLSVAMLSARRQHASSVLHFWRALAAHRAGRRRARVHARLRGCFDAWVAFVPLQRRLDWVDAGVETLFERAGDWQRRCLLLRWGAFSRQRARRRRAARLLRGRVDCAVRRRYWTEWRVVWCRALLWREREGRLERVRAEGLRALRAREVEDLVEERDSLLRMGRELVAAVARLEEAVGRAQTDLGEQDKALAAAQSMRSELEAALEASQGDLRVASMERERYRAVEILCEGERARTELAVARRRQQAEAILAGLQRESSALRGEMQQAREQAGAVEAAARREVSSNLSVLRASAATAEDLRALVEGQQRYMEELETSLVSLQDEMGSIKGRLRDTVREGVSLLDDGEAELRARSLAVKELRAGVGLREARVRALRDSLEEQRRGLGAQHAASTRSAEVKELSEIRSAVGSVGASLAASSLSQYGSSNSSGTSEYASSAAGSSGSSGD